jgi:hypothetical protein
MSQWHPLATGGTICSSVSATWMRTVVRTDLTRSSRRLASLETGIYTIFSNVAGIVAEVKKPVVEAAVGHLL